MADTQATTAHVDHPAPARRKAGLGLLAFGLLGAPLIWGTHFLINVTIASRTCSVLAPIKPPMSIHFSVLLIDIVAFIIAITALGLSLKTWRATKHEGDDNQSAGASSAEHTAHVGEGRTRFMAMGGIILSATFSVAILFDTVAAIMVTSCGK